MQNHQSIHVRSLDDKDIPRYRELRLRGLREFPTSFLEAPEDFEKIPLEEIAARMRTNREAGSLSLVAERSDGVLVGLASFAAHAHERIRHRAHVWGVYVVPEAQGLGVGGALMRELTARAAADPKLETLLLSVVSDNAAAVRLYTSVGFSIYGTDLGAMRYDGVLIDEYLMRKELRAGALT